LDAPSAARALGIAAEAVVSVCPSGEDAAATAARFAGQVCAGLLRSAGARVGDAARARRRAISFAAVAAGLLLAAAGFEFWGVQRELTAVRARREVIHPAVQEAMAAREALTAVTDRLATLDSADRSAPRWSSIIATLSDELPTDAYLSAFRATGDTIRLEGSASRATGVFEALQRAPWMRSVRAEAPIRQEADADGVTAERFILAAQIAPREGRQ
jgi:Tfp pilus assembly protein PilN